MCVRHSRRLFRFKLQSANLRSHRWSLIDRWWPALRIAHNVLMFAFFRCGFVSIWINSPWYRFNWYHLREHKCVQVNEITHTTHGSRPVLFAAVQAMRIYKKKSSNKNEQRKKKMFLLNLNSVNERLQRHKFRVRWLNVCVLCVLFMFYFLVRTNVLREQTKRFSCTTNQAETKTNTHTETRTEQTRARSLTTSDCLHTKAFI